MEQYITVTNLDPKLATVEAARLERDELLYYAAQVTSVGSAAEAEKASTSLKDLKAFSRQVEARRKDVKAPIVDIAKKIDGLAGELTDKINSEAERLARAVGDWQAKERRRLEQAEREAQEKERRIREETQRKLDDAAAAGKSDKAIEKIEDKGFAQIAQARAEPATVAQPKISGLAQRTEIKFEVTDIKALYAARPECVELSPNATMIRGLLKAKVELPGVRSWEETKSIVR